MSLARFDLGFPNQRCSDSTCWLGWRPAWMGKPYSMDLRERVVAAVETAPDAATGLVRFQPRSLMTPSPSCRFFGQGNPTAASCRYQNQQAGIGRRFLHGTAVFPVQGSRSGGTSRSFLGASARSIARSASATASRLVAAWPLKGELASNETSHFQSCRAMP